MASSNTLVVDVGNGSFHFAILGRSGLATCCLPLPTPQEFSTNQWMSANRLSEWLADLPRQAAPSRCVIASVHQPAADFLSRWIRSNRPDWMVQRITHNDLGLKHSLPTLEKTGIDRLVAAWGAAQFYAAEGFPGAIVADCGSAVTVDWIDSAKVYQGGVIYPGARLSSIALSNKTDGLPLVDPLFGDDFKGSSPSNLPSPFGKSTRQAIELGIFYSQLGAIQGTILAAQAAATQARNDQPIVVVTGGGIRPLLSLLPNRWIYREFLVLESLAAFAGAGFEESNGNL